MSSQFLQFQGQYAECVNQRHFFPLTGGCSEGLAVTSFLGFSCPNLLLVFLNYLLFLGTTVSYFSASSAVLGLFPFHCFEEEEREGTG